MDNPTAALARFVAEIRTDALPDRVRALAVQHTLDVVAGFHAGLDIPEATSVRRVLGDGVADRAGAIAMTAHAAESDPIHAGTAICAGMVAVPPALLLCPDGATALAAVVAGYETAIRIGVALGSARLLGRGWWPTALCGGAGAAAAASRAMGLAPEATAHAIALALVQAGGLSAGGAEAPEARNLLGAMVVRTGVEAAEAAAAGLAGPAEPLTGERGFLAAFGPESLPGALTEGLGTDWKIAQTSLKAFPCALQAQTALEALRMLIDENDLSATDIEAVTVGLPEPMRRIVDRPGPPVSRFAAAASLQFLASCVVHDGDVLPSRLGETGRTDSRLGAFMASVAVAHDPGLDAAFPAAWPARVRIDGGKGRFETLLSDHAGHPDRPLDLAATRERFRRYSAGRLDHETQDRILDAVDRLPEPRDLALLRDCLADA